MRVKIAIIIEAAVGGTRTHIVDVLTFLPQDIFDITFIYSTHRADPNFSDNLKDIKASGIRMIELPMKKSITSFANLRSIIDLTKLFRREKFDVIHLHSAIAGFVGRVAAIAARNRSSIFYSPHGGSFHMMEKGMKAKFFKLVERLLISKRLRFIAVSNFEKENICYKIGASEKDITVIYNGLRTGNTPHFPTESKVLFEAAGLSIPDKSFVIVYPAVFLPAKGHMNFLESLKKNTLADDVYVLLAGHGPEEEKIKRMIDQNSLSEKVLTIGFRSDLVNWLFACDLVILPSKGEVFGYVILEAFQAGKAVFATKVGGIPELIDNGKDGLVFEYNDIEGMIAAINHYSGNRHLLETMGQSGEQKIRRKFSIQGMIEQLSAIYRDAATKKG